MKYFIQWIWRIWNIRFWVNWVTFLSITDISIFQWDINSIPTIKIFFFLVKSPFILRFVTIFMELDKELKGLQNNIFFKCYKKRLLNIFTKWFHSNGWPWSTLNDRSALQLIMWSSKTGRETLSVASSMWHVAPCCWNQMLPISSSSIFEHKN